MVTHTSIILRMVTHHPKDCHPTSKRVVIPSMVIHHPELRKSDKALRNSNKTWSLTLAQPSLLCLQTWGQSKQSCQRYYENYQTFPFIQISQAEGTQTSKIERSSTNKNMRGSWSWRILQKYWKYHHKACFYVKSSKKKCCCFLSLCNLWSATKHEGDHKPSVGTLL